MPAFGAVEQQQIPGGIGIVPVPSGDGRQIQELHRKMQADRMLVPDELEAITDLSDATTVWIYSVGAWPQFVSLGSLGSHTIPGIPEEHVLVAGDLTVSRPLPVKGIPSETYPVDDGGRRIYHRPQQHDPLRRHTGMHLALEIIGAGAKSKQDNDLRPWGCFVSPIPEQKDPGPNGTPEQRRLFAQWKPLVEAAKSALAGNFARKKAAANEAFKVGTFQKLYLNDDRIGIIARVTHATKAECPWMENMVTSVENKQCIGCRGLIAHDALVCNHAGCGQKQVSDKVYEQEIAKRMRAANGEPEAPRRGRPAKSQTASDPEPESDEPEQEDDDIL